jgi:hypothetical protein
MKNEQARADRRCKIFVLIVFGTVVIAFIVALWFFKQAGVWGHRSLHAETSLIGNQFVATIRLPPSIQVKHRGLRLPDRHGANPSSYALRP